VKSAEEDRALDSGWHHSPAECAAPPAPREPAPLKVEIVNPPVPAVAPVKRRGRQPKDKTA
jgi:hypothetical protein